MSEAKVTKTDEEWEAELTPEQYAVCRGSGTERAFTGEYWDEKAAGLYRCRCCAQALFRSESKYDSGSGWPSFFEGVDAEAIQEISDVTHGMKRTEILCNRCQSHLGHVFPDGPQPTGLRYCVNSASLKLERDEPT
jgi:peptide-methionine (R)-S-oxide reductase